jgi:hypothetical protein
VLIIKVINRQSGLAAGIEIDKLTAGSGVLSPSHRNKSKQDAPYELQILIEQAKSFIRPLA